MQIRPLFDRIVIEPIDSEEKTKSGIVLLVFFANQKIRKKVEDIG